MFTLHVKNLAQIKAVIKTYGSCYFHGDGNMYTKKEDSDFRKDFSNPSANNAASVSCYRVKFNSIDEVPGSIEELSQLLLKSYQNELIASNRPKEVAGIQTIKVDDDDPKEAKPVSILQTGSQSPDFSGGKTKGDHLTEEEEFQKLLAEEEKLNKGNV